jgi:hypothetical protein
VNPTAISLAETGRRQLRAENLVKIARALGVPVEMLEESPTPLGEASESWRDRLRALSGPKKRDMALAAAEGYAWPGNVSAGSLAALKGFCAEHGVTPADVLAELEAETPGLDETLARLDARAREQAARFADQARRELDDALHQGRDAG